jgi:hypothetical protein
MSWYGWSGSGGRSDDHELDEIFSDRPDLLETARRLRQVPHPVRDPDPAFRMALRRQLIQAAYERQAVRRPAFWHGWLRPGRLALAGAIVGAFLIAAVVVNMLSNPSGGTSQEVLSSPLQGSHQVAVVQPITLRFNQPMDHASVEQSIQIQPATQVKSFTWNGNEVQVQPANGLAPNTQYQVKVATTARTSSNQPLAAQKPVTFVTLPSPTPTPTTTATPSPTPTATPAVTGEHQLSPSGSPAPVWAPDGSAVYVITSSGQLDAVPPAAGGQPRQVQPDGVALAAVGPDGAAAFVRNQQAVYGQTSIAVTKPLALGFQGSKLVVVDGRQVEAAGGAQLATLAEDAVWAQFSPNGQRLAYMGASSLRMLDLTSGQDTAVGAATGTGSWSRDGSHYAYPTASSVFVTDGTGPGTKIADASGVAAISWSAQDELLLSEQASLWLSGADGANLHKLIDGAYAQSVWAPNGGTFAFKRSGGVWVGTVGSARTAPARSQDDMVNAFMTARVQGQADQAGTFLDTHGKQAFASGLKLTYPASPQLSRYFILLSQPGHVVVRMILAAPDGSLDETLTIVRDASGQPLVDGATDTPRTPSAGPDVIGVSVASGEVRVMFDADLDPSTVAGVSIQGVRAQATYNAQERTVVLAVPNGLTAGQSYRLLLSPALKDVNHTPATAFSLAFVGPAS